MDRSARTGSARQPASATDRAARRIFIIGLNKCATQAIDLFFRRHGMVGVHFHNGRLARKMLHNIAAGRKPLTGYESAQVISDMNFLTKDVMVDISHLFDRLYDAYPDALFILNTRDREDWIRSRARHANGTFLQRFRSALEAPNDETVLDYWREEWDTHHNRVLQFFAGSRSDSLFVWDIDSPDFDKLQAQLGMALDPTFYVNINATPDAKSIAGP